MVIGDQRSAAGNECHSGFVKADSALWRFGLRRWVQDLHDLAQDLDNRSFMHIQPSGELFDSLNAPQLTRYLAGLTVYVAVAQHAPFSSAASFRASSGVPRSASRIFAKARTTKMLI